MALSPPLLAFTHKVWIGMLCQQGSQRAEFQDLGGYKKPSFGPSEQDQVSDCLDHNIQTIAAGPSQ
eukprot:scaffold59905_cov95-Cyclotella_meneghiniana.AAC.1